MIFIALLVTVAISMWAQFRVQKNFNKFAQVPAKSGMTGAEVARLILDRRGVYDVTVQPVQGVLTDHYDPRSKTVRLSEEVYDKSSISAISVAAHEVGHAIQHNEEYAFLNFRSALAPIASFTSRFVYILMFIGFASEFMQLVDIAIVFYAIALLFQVITLPVEFNASSRAFYNLEDFGILAADEVSSSKKVLGAAALTYVAATAVSAMNLLRILVLRNSRRR